MNKKKKDYLSLTLVYQFIVCTLLFGSLLGLKKFDTNMYYTIKTGFYDNIGTDFGFIENNRFKNNTNPDDIINNTIQQTQEKSTEVNPPKDVKDTKTENKTDLSVEINDNNDTATNTLPQNVSVSSYILNQKMIMPVNGDITSPFGIRKHPLTGETHFHTGIDIAADTGTPIYAAFSGEVVHADYDEWNGNFIKIKHENNIMTVYCHCQKLNVKKGDHINAGDVIATVGSTGSSTGPHLHFEFRVNDISYNPLMALNEAINAV